ncbi:MAG: hypothetical protein FWH03_08230 [Firmicutes bacterium]|nr:hypothetical protein [Bacillota bacterium]
MYQLEVILSLVGTAVGFLAAAATFLAKFIKSAKAKKIAEQTVKIADAVLPYIKQAETFVHYSGAEKKEFVLTKANQYAIEQGMTFDAGLAGEKIEELVRLTKEVNKRHKDKLISAPQSVLPLLNNGSD